MKPLLQLAGWTGTALIVSAYFLNSQGLITPADWQYPVMNIVGSLLFGTELFFKRSFSGVTLQAVWILVAALNLVRLAFPLS